MRTLKIIEHMSLDGVMQNSRDDNDFPYGDWTASYRTPAGREMVMAIHGERFDLVLGRRTYDLVVGLLANGAEQSDRRPNQRRHEVCRYPPSG